MPPKCVIPPLTPFVPRAIGLSDDFLLTDYTRLKGCSCKVPQHQLRELLSAVGISPSYLVPPPSGADATQPSSSHHEPVPSSSSSSSEGPVVSKGSRTEGTLVTHDTSSLTPPHSASNRAQTTSSSNDVVGTAHSTATAADNVFVGMDCSIVPLLPKSATSSSDEPQQYLISTTDFFFPSVEDPYLQGQIGCANVLSDLYAMGIDRCDNLLMLLASSTDMDHDERHCVTQQIMRGFGERAAAGETKITGGQTVFNPWPLIGGVAMAVVASSDMIPPTGLLFNDVLVLTKPLGSQVAVNLMQWTKRPSPMYDRCIKGKMDVKRIEQLYYAAGRNMARLNRNASKLMKVHRAHGATDVTGFGLLGHCSNLAEVNSRREGDKEDEGSDPQATINVGEMQIVIHTLPILEPAIEASRLMDDKYKLLKGWSAETSGGLLVALPSAEAARAYIQDLTSKEEFDVGTEAWIVGICRRRPRGAAPAVLSPNVQILAVSV